MGKLLPDHEGAFQKLSGIRFQAPAEERRPPDERQSKYSCHTGKIMEQNEEERFTDMKESIAFLGSSHGDPSLTRFCSSTLYRIGDVNILIDAGEPVSALLIRHGLKPSSLDAVFLTHMHVDHANGLGGLYYQILKYPDRKVELFLSDPAAKEPFLNWNRAMCNRAPDEKYLSVTAIAPDFRWEKNGITIRAISTEHMASVHAPSYAYSIVTPQSKILHTGDLSADFHDFPLKDSNETYDLCVCEATHIRNHPEILVRMLKKAPVRKLVFTHIGPSWTDGNEHLLKELTAGLPYETLIACDGMVTVLHE